MGAGDFDSGGALDVYDELEGRRLAVELVDDGRTSGVADDWETDGLGRKDRFGAYDDELGDGEKVVPNDMAADPGKASFLGSGDVTSGCCDGLYGRVGAKSDANPPDEDA